MRYIRTCVIPALAFVVLIQSTGCSISSSLLATVAPYQESSRTRFTKTRSELEAKQIWKRNHSRVYDRRPCGKDVKLGFVYGYTETALGGTGCPPPMPIAPFLSIHTLSHSYPSANHWYEGYHLGHTAALSRGVDRRRLAPINPELRCNTDNYRAEPIEGKENFNEFLSNVAEEDLDCLSSENQVEQRTEDNQVNEFGLSSDKERELPAPNDRVDALNAPVPDQDLDNVQ